MVDRVPSLPQSVEFLQPMLTFRSKNLSSACNDPSRPVRDVGARRISRLLITAAVVCLHTGCRSWPWHSGPVPESVVSCRELSQRALTSIESGQYQEAEGLLGRAIESCPIDPEARRNYAEVLLKRNAVDEALSHMEEAIRLTPHDTSLLVRAGEVYLDAGRMAEAEGHANRAINLDGNLADAWALRGRIRLAQGRRREALADLHRAIGYRPEDPRLLREVASVYMALNLPGRSLLYLQTLADTHVAGEEPVDLIDRQGQAYLALGRFQDAATCYRTACLRDPGAAELHYRLAEAELQAGRVDQARTAIATALQLQPNHVAGRQLVARLADHARVSDQLR